MPKQTLLLLAIYIALQMQLTLKCDRCRTVAWLLSRAEGGLALVRAKPTHIDREGQFCGEQP
jgi:hypothetical protein